MWLLKEMMGQVFLVRIAAAALSARFSQPVESLRTHLEGVRESNVGMEANQLEHCWLTLFKSLTSQNCQGQKLLSSRLFQRTGGY